MHYVIFFVEGGFPPRRVCLRHDIRPDESGFDESNPYRATVKLGFKKKEPHRFLQNASGRARLAF